MSSTRKLLTGSYLVFFVLYSLATRFTLTASFMDGAINNTAYRLILIAGCVLALWQLIAVRRELRTGDTYLLALFTVVLCIGILLNRSYGLMDNVYGLLTFGFQVVLFYYLRLSMTENELTGWLKRIIFLGSFLWDIACAASVAQYLMNIRYVCQYASDKPRVRQGIVDGRLFGLFTDPNFAAFTSLLLIFGLWYLLQHTKRRILRVFAYGSIAVNTIYIVMSNSRTVYLSVVGSVLFFVLLRSYKEKQTAGSDEENAAAHGMIKHLLVRGLCTVLCLALTYLAVLFSMQGIAKLISPERNTTEELVRDDIDKTNISNNRFTIWKAYLELYSKKPVFGFSMRSALPYADANAPDGYLSQTQYVTHNGYLSLLVETGIVGFAVMAVFLIALLIRAVKRCRQKENISTSYVLFATWILSVLIFCLCFHDIFFTLNIETMLFWCGLGCIQSSSAIKASHRSSMASF